MPDEKGLQAEEKVIDPIKDDKAPLTQAKTSAPAVASLIAGILGFTCLPAILAIIFGIIALVKIAKSQGALKGQASAIIGICLGSLWIILTPFIFIITAIAIPNIITARTAASEAAAIVSLKNLVTAESMWQLEDIDGNGRQDYWTYDVSCLYRMFKADSTTRVELIPRELAEADFTLTDPTDTKTFGDDTIDTLSHRLAQTLLPTAKNGYFFRALKYDAQGKPYNQNLVIPHWQKIVKAGELGIGVEEPPEGIPATNDTRFGFIAVPAVYGKTGKRIYIVNQDGTIYATDPGSDENKWINQWPADDPCYETGPGGEPWQPIND